MSNNSLIARIQASLELLEAHQSSARVLADSIRGNGKALEAMPYVLIKEMEDMAMDLDIVQWQDEDGFLPELGPIFIRVRDWLSKLPRDV
ncbi:hypothetical protein [Duganella aceris]|uniref:Uncharacterized protein n=1 Tax=Duganella aceris TaxID=2703883 RepID=A0ABX0FPI1_9BURK|nr:hypothetical protein [Duganella aceris]NGZ86393.1 hypothetical protein [Duganella aceris]